MSGSFWIFLAGAVVLVAGYLFAMRVLYRQSQDVDAHIDFAKIKPLKNDDGDD